MNGIGVTGRWVMVGVASLTATCAAMGDVPSISELLDRYTQALESTKSFTGDWETSSDYSYGLPGASHAGKSFRYGQTRHDDERVYHREYSWGNLGPRFPDVPQSAAHYNLGIPNGKTGVSYQHNRTASPGTGQAARFAEPLPKVSLSRLGGVGSLAGYIAADERLDMVLRGADRISVREAPENVGGSDCWVIDAHTKYGQYTLWLDPQHGYHPAQVAQKAGPGEYIHEHRLGPSDAGTAYVQNVRFEQVDGVWVPMEADTGFDRTGAHVFNKESTHFKRTNIVLNPNHDALGSFSDPIFENPNNDPELVNGTKVRIGRAPILYTWRNGRAVPDVDDIVLDELDKVTDELRSKGQALPADPNENVQEKRGKGQILPVDPDKNVLEKGLSALDLLERYARTQHGLRSLIVEAENTIKTVSGRREQTELSRSNFRTDGLRVRHCESTWGRGRTTQSNPDYHSFLYAGNDLIEYSKPSEWDKGSVVAGRNDFRVKTLISLDYRGAPLLGICPGDTQRVDHVLKRAKGLSLAGAPESVGGVPCYVVEGQTECGRYRLWIDPKHDYHVARLEIERKVGDKVDATELSGNPMVFSLSNVRFQQINSVWVPMEADMQMVLRNPGTTCTWHHRRTHVALNPDHAAVKSFVADDIPDGTEVKRLGDNVTRYVWRKGEIVMEATKNVAR